MENSAASLNIDDYEILRGVISLVYDDPSDKSVREFNFMLIKNAGGDLDYFRASILSDFITLLKSDNISALQDSFWNLNIGRKYCKLFSFSAGLAGVNELDTDYLKVVFSVQ